MLQRLIRRVRYLARRRRLEAELAEELESHRALRQQQLEREGLSKREAADGSGRALGNALVAREDARGVWIWPWLESAWQDVHYGARGRTREIGIRMALGARTRKMLWMVVRETLSVVVVGALLGIGLALAVGRALASFLFGVEPARPAIAALAVLLLLAVTALAAWLPARRAMRVDPITALRFE